MIRLAHIADVHLSERVHFAGTLRVLDEFCAAVERSVHDRDPFDLVLIAGDIADPRRAPARATPTERNAFARLVVRLANVAPVVLVRGNHDALGDWTFLDLIETTHEVRWVDNAPESLTLAQLPGVVVHAVPWQSPRGWEDFGDDCEAGMEAVFRGIGDLVEAEPDALHIGVGHMSITGGRLPSGQALVGAEVQVPASMLMLARCNYFALGHLHEFQRIPGVRAAYSGSPNRLNFGEAGKRCGWLDVRVDSDGSTIDFVELAADRMVTIDADVRTLDDGRVVLDVVEDAPDCANADVRVRVRVPEGVAAEDEIAALVARVEGGGGRVTLERIALTELRAREGADEIAAQPSIAAKVETYMEQRGHDAEQTRRVLGRLERLQERGA